MRPTCPRKLDGFPARTAAPISRARCAVAIFSRHRASTPAGALMALVWVFCVLPIERASRVPVEQIMHTGIRHHATLAGTGAFRVRRCGVYTGWRYPRTRRNPRDRPESRGLHSVDTVRGNSNNSISLPPRLADLRKLAAAAVEVIEDATVEAALSWRLRQRLQPERIREIVTKCEAGSMTPALCDEYGLSKSGIRA